MTPDTLIGITERNSRNAELRIRTAEQHLSELLGEQLALEQDITQRLGKIAALHLDQGNTQNEQVAAALNLRQQSQDLLHQQLRDAEQTVAQALAGKE